MLSVLGIKIHKKTKIKYIKDRENFKEKDCCLTGDKTAIFCVCYLCIRM